MIVHITDQYLYQALYLHHMTGHQFQMMNYGDILQIHLLLENDLVYEIIMYHQVLNGRLYILHDDGGEHDELQCQMI